MPDNNVLQITTFGAVHGRDSTLAIARTISAAARGDTVLVLDVVHPRNSCRVCGKDAFA